MDDLKDLDASDQFVKSLLTSSERKNLFAKEFVNVLRSQPNSVLGLRCADILGHALQRDVQNFADKRKINVGCCIDDVVEKDLEVYSEWTVVSSNQHRVLHPFSAISRRIEVLILKEKAMKISKDVNLDGIYSAHVVDVGGKPEFHYDDNEMTVHVCKPVIDLKDKLRESVLYSNMVSNVNLRAFCSTNVCLKLAQECSVKAPVVMWIHSTYDQTVTDIADTMVLKSAIIGYGTTLFDPLMAVMTKGFIPRHNVWWTVEDDKIYFDFKDGQSAYCHDYKNYMALFTNHVIFSSDGTPFLVDLFTYHAGIQRFSVHPIQVPLLSGTTRLSFDCSIYKDKCLVTYVDFVGAELSTNWYDPFDITCVLAKSMKRKTILVDKKLFNDVVNQTIDALKSDSADIISKIARFCTVRSSRFVINSTTIIPEKKLEPDEAAPLISAAIQKAYCARYKLSTTFKNFSKLVVDLRKKGAPGMFSRFLYYFLNRTPNSCVDEKLSAGEESIVRFLQFFEPVVSPAEVSFEVSYGRDVSSRNVMNVVLRELSDSFKHVDEVREFFELEKEKREDSLSEGINFDSGSEISDLSEASHKISRKKNGSLVNDVYVTFGDCSGVKLNLEKIPGDGFCGLHVIRKIIPSLTKEKIITMLRKKLLADGSDSGRGLIDVPLEQAINVKQCYVDMFEIAWILNEFGVDVCNHHGPMNACVRISSDFDRVAHIWYGRIESLQHFDLLVPDKCVSVEKERSMGLPYFSVGLNDREQKCDLSPLNVTQLFSNDKVLKDFRKRKMYELFSKLVLSKPIDSVNRKWGTSFEVVVKLTDEEFKKVLKQISIGQSTLFSVSYFDAPEDNNELIDLIGSLLKSYSVVTFDAPPSLFPGHRQFYVVARNYRGFSPTNDVFDRNEIMRIFNIFATYRYNTVVAFKQHYEGMSLLGGADCKFDDEGAMIGSKRVIRGRVKSLPELASIVKRDNIDVENLSDSELIDFVGVNESVKEGVDEDCDDETSSFFTANTTLPVKKSVVANDFKFLRLPSVVKNKIVPQYASKVCATLLRPDNIHLSPKEGFNTTFCFVRRTGVVACALGLFTKYFYLPVYKNTVVPGLCYRNNALSVIIKDVKVAERPSFVSSVFKFSLSCAFFYTVGYFLYDYWNSEFVREKEIKCDCKPPKQKEPIDCEEKLKPGIARFVKNKMFPALYDRFVVRDECLIKQKEFDNDEVCDDGIFRQSDSCDSDSDDDYQETNSVDKDKRKNDPPVIKDRQSLCDTVRTEVSTQEFVNNNVVTKVHGDTYEQKALTEVMMLWEYMSQDAVRTIVNCSTMGAGNIVNHTKKMRDPLRAAEFFNNTYPALGIYDVVDKKILFKPAPKYRKDITQISHVHNNDGRILSVNDCSLDRRYYFFHCNTFYNFFETALTNVKQIVSERKFGNIPKISFVNGAPGSGKSTEIVNEHSVNLDLVLAVSSGAVDNLKQKVLKTYSIKPSRRHYRTLDSYLMNPSITNVDVLHVDEAPMTHYGHIVAAIRLSRAQKVVLYGDLKQNVYSCREPIIGNSIKNFSLPIGNTVKTTKLLTKSYRCPVDVCELFRSKYKDVGDVDFISASEVRKSLKAELISDKVEIRKLKNYVYLTFTKSEKDEVAKDLNIDVFTIGEFQGNESENVCLVRIRPLKSNPIYETESQIFVGLTRHTKNFLYCTVTPDKLYCMLSKGGYVPTTYYSEKLERPDPMPRLTIPKYRTEDVVWAEELLNGFGVQDGVDVDDVVYTMVPEKVLSSRICQDLEPNITALQHYYVSIAGVDNAIVDNSYDPMFAETDENNYALMPGKVSIASHGAAKHSVDECLKPVLTTACPPKSSQSLVNLVSAVKERNAGVPMLQLPCDPYDLADLAFNRCVSMFFDERRYRSRTHNVIAPNSRAIADWMRLQPTDLQKRMETFINVYVDTPESFEASVKRNPKPKLDRMAHLKNPPGQVIAASNKFVNALFSPMFRRIATSLQNSLREGVYINSGCPIEELAEKMSSSCPPSYFGPIAEVLELDLSKFDKSQDLVCLLLDCKLMKFFGIDDFYIKFWYHIHIETKLFNYRHSFTQYIKFQRKSGDPSTYLGNTFVTMCTVALYSNAREFSLALFSGDDSLCLSRLPIQVDFELISTTFNFEVKRFSYKSLYFCSKFLISVADKWVFVPDLYKVLVKLGRGDLVNWEHAEEYRISLSDYLEPLFYHEIIDPLDLGLAERYDAEFSCAQVLQQLAYLVSDKKAFKNLFSDFGRILASPNDPLPSVGEFVHRKILATISVNPKLAVNWRNFKGNGYELSSFDVKQCFVIFAPQNSGFEMLIEMLPVHLRVCVYDHTLENFHYGKTEQPLPGSIILTDNLDIALMTKGFNVLCLIPDEDVFDLRNCGSFGGKDYSYDSVYVLKRKNFNCIVTNLRLYDVVKIVSGPKLGFDRGF